MSQAARFSKTRSPNDKAARRVLHQVSRRRDCAGVCRDYLRDQYAAHAKLDVFPEFAPPQVVIQTEAVGLASEQVEQLVTRPIELAVNGVANLESIRSQSIQGLSVITAVFQDGTDIYRARQMVSERLVTAV